MRRDLPLDVDPAALVLAPPDRSQLKEIFRRFEFRNLLGRVDDLDEALPAAAVEVTGVVLTKLDGSAKGGIALAIALDEAKGGLGLPIKLVGLGESADDLIPFDPAAFVDALLTP